MICTQCDDKGEIRTPDGDFTPCPNPIHAESVTEESEAEPEGLDSPFPATPTPEAATIYNSDGSETAMQTVPDSDTVPQPVSETEPVVITTPDP